MAFAVGPFGTLVDVYVRPGPWTDGTVPWQACGEREITVMPSFYRWLLDAGYPQMFTADILNAEWRNFMFDDRERWMRA